MVDWFFILLIMVVVGDVDLLLGVVFVDGDVVDVVVGVFGLVVELLWVLDSEFELSLIGWLVLIVVNNVFVIEVRGCILFE